MEWRQLSCRGYALPSTTFHQPYAMGNAAATVIPYWPQRSARHRTARLIWSFCLVTKTDGARGPPNFYSVTNSARGKIELRLVGA